jgi:hypothetical protein
VAATCPREPNRNGLQQRANASQSGDRSGRKTTPEKAAARQPRLNDLLERFVVGTVCPDVFPINFDHGYRSSSFEASSVPM